MMSARADGTRGRGRAARAMSALVLMLVLALLAHRAPPATAGSAQRVVVVRALDDDGPAHQVTTLLEAELKAAGFEMVEIDPDPRGGADVEVVAAAWTRLQPVAILVIVAPLAPHAGTGTDVTANAGPAIDFWIEDPAIGRRSARRIEVTGAANVAAADLALKAVEILRGTLVEVTIARAAVPASPESDIAAPKGDIGRPAAPPPPATARFFAEGFGLAVGAGALGGTGAPASVAPLLSLGWGSTSGYALRLTASDLGSTAELSAEGGSVRVRQGWLLVEGLRAFRASARAQPLLSAGTGFHHIDADGRGSSPLFPGHAENKLVAALSAGAGLALRLGTRMALVADVDLLWLSSATRIVVNGTETARIGGVSAIATLSLFARL
jgi:hypothetical protein